MMRLLRKLSGGVAGEASISLLFFALYYLYLWLVVDLRLIYHGGGVVTNFPVFYTRWGFFREFLCHPGGVVVYASAFLAQLFYIGWAGALVATVQAILMWLCTRMIVSVISGWRVRWVCFIPSILLLVPYARYSYQFTAGMTVLAALGFACLYLWIVSKGRVPSLLVFAALSIIVYVATGTGYLLFTALCAIYELLIRRRQIVCVMYLLLATIVLQVVGMLVFDEGIVDTLLCFSPFSRADSQGMVEGMMTMSYAFYLFVPVAVSGLWLIRRFSAGPSGKLFVWSEKPVSKVIGLALPFVIGVAVGGLSHNSDIKTSLEIDYYTCRKMWPEVIGAAMHLPKDKFASYAVNRALYHTGRLTEDMFAYPQRPETLLVPAAGKFPSYWASSDGFIDFGQVGLAGYLLGLSMEANGERPIILKRLALVAMAKNNIGEARACLGAISRTLFDAEWARGYLEKIDKDPNLSTDTEVQRLRSFMVDKDRCFREVKIDMNTLLDLLDKNKQNRMIFEYSMAAYLLTLQLDKFIENLNRLDDFDYPGIPRVYEEAILLYDYKKRVETIVPGREIRPETRKRFEGFLNVYIGRYKSDKKAAFDELAKDYGDSYFFYCLYGQSGMKK